MKKHLLTFSKAKSYWKEILFILIIKIILLTGLYYTSFKDPLILDDQKAGEHLLH